MKYQRSWRYQKAVYSILREHLSMRKQCSKWVPCLLAVDQKQQRVDDSERCLQLFQRNKKEFCVNMWQWIKHWSSTSLQSQIGSQLSGQRQVKAVQSDQRCKHQQASFWPSYFGMHKVFCSSISMKKGRAIDSEYYIAILVRLKEEIAKKTATNEEEKSALSPKQCTVLEVDRYDGETTWIALRIACAPTLFSRSGPQRLLAVCRPQKNAQGKEIWLQRRSDIGNWGVFWSQR